MEIFMPKDDRKEEKIKALTAENKRLKLEVEALKRELEDTGKIKHTRGDRTVAAFEKASRTEKLFSRKYYTTYLFENIRSTSLFNIYERIIRAIKRYTLLTTTLKILTFIITFIESSAIFVFVASAFIISVPITVFLSYAAIVMSFLGSKRLNRRNKELLSGKNITLMFPQRGKAFEQGSFFRGMVRDTAKKPDSVVVIVSPYVFGVKGISSRQTPYLASRLEGDNILIVRKHYYFTLKKRMLGSMADRTTVIY